MKAYNAKDIRNIAIAGHGGRGKTTLAEAMLYTAKATDRLGRVADGTTVLDFDAEEKKRKATVSTAVAAIEWNGAKINIIDTPGLFDFAGGMSEGIRAADSVLIPVQCEYYALEGLSQLMTTVRMVKKALNRKLVMEGVLLTMFDGRTNLSIQVVEEVKKHFPGEVFSAVVPRNVRLSEAPSHGKPITAYDRMCRGAEAYLALADEILKKNDRKGRS